MRNLYILVPQLWEQLVGWQNQNINDILSNWLCFVPKIPMAIYALVGSDYEEPGVVAPDSILSLCSLMGILSL